MAIKVGNRGYVARNLPRQIFDLTVFQWIKIWLFSKY